MSELRTLLADTTEKVLGGLDGLDFAHAWARVEDTGLHKVLVPEDQGGFGGTWSDALIVIRACGYHAVALPLPEAVLACALCADAGLAVPDGPLTLCEETQGAITDGAFRGEMWRAPYGRDCNTIIGLGGTELIVGARDAAQLTYQHANMAGEDADVFFFADKPVQSAQTKRWDYLRQYHCTIMTRAAQMAGAMQAALDLSVQYARERQQFGKPLASFQAIQQQLAVFAEETAAAGMAAAAAFAREEGREVALMQWREPPFEIMAAKLRANMAVGTATSVAHQVHGAMGFTKEYKLQRLTKLLWRWRGEYGNDRWWADALGKAIAAQGAEGFWPALVSPATIAPSGPAD
jgi:acyl-CoA dehydrogenase